MSSNKPGKSDAKSTGGRCPICEDPAAPAYAPFCSKRCGDVDLHRWLSGSYAIPAAEDESDGVREERDGPTH